MSRLWSTHISQAPQYPSAGTFTSSRVLKWHFSFIPENADVTADSLAYASSRTVWWLGRSRPARNGAPEAAQFIDRARKTSWTEDDQPGP